MAEQGKDLVTSGNKGHRWKKGQSGNPSGRPKVVGHIQELARLEGAASIKALVEIRDDKKAHPSARAAAANALLDRGYGRPTQPIATMITADPNALTDAELAVIATGGDRTALPAPTEPS